MALPPTPAPRIGRPARLAGAGVAVLASAATWAVRRDLRQARSVQPREPPAAHIDVRVAPRGVVPPDDAHMAPPLRLATLGDSSIAGIGAEHVDGCLGVQIAQRVADALGRPVHVSGYGVSGARTADVAAEQAPALAAANAPDAVIVVVGANDIVHLTPPLRYLSDVARLYGALQNVPGAPVVACSLPEIRAVTVVGHPLRDAAAVYGRVLAMLQRRALERTPGVTWVDARRIAGPIFLSEPRAMSADGFHPSTYGYRLLADALAPAVIAALAARVTTTVRPPRAACDG